MAVSCGSGPRFLRASGSDVVIPWTQAKLLVYYLNFNVVVHEANTGAAIKLRPDVMPTEPTISEEELENPVTRQIIDAIRKLRSEFVKAQGL